MIRLVLVCAMLASLAAPAAAQEIRPTPGEKVRIRMRDPAELEPSIKLLGPPEAAHEAKLLALTADSILVEIDAPVVRVLFASIGHWTSEYSLHLSQLETLEVERGRFRAPTPSRVGLALLGGAAAGFAISRFNWTCPSGPCDNASRNAGLLAGSIVTFVMAWPWTTEWVEVPLQRMP